MFFGISIDSLDLSSFNNSKVTDTNHMFASTKIKNLDLSGFQINNVSNINSIFQVSTINNLYIKNNNMKKLIQNTGISSETLLSEKY